MIMTKRETGQNTGVFQDVTDDQADDDEDQDAALSIAQCSMEKCKGDQGQYQECWGY